MTRILTLALLVAAVGCGDDARRPGDRLGTMDGGGVGFDASGIDGGLDGRDLGGASVDGGGLDGGGVGVDGGPGTDGGAGTSDAGSPDMGPPDMGPPDMGPPDLGPPDLGPPSGGCVSGATGTHVARFRWNGSSSGSTAWISYEANNLPDTSRWRAGAYSRGPIGSYTPTWQDPFLAEGGVELGGTVFFDIELSTIGLSSIRNVTIALYGRSYNTTTSGSFTWMTFDGSGASPYAGVSNGAPYAWYGANATAAFSPGNGGVLLRLEAGGPSNTLVVNKVEICFDAS
ncbi:MAG: hypothetical protein JJ863_06020 [Deltaproteobacteria bacterium]|nr:hypothetical protein [Deltaproteobacteria bacterium]